MPSPSHRGISMNSLSWMIYAAEAFGGLKVAASIVTGVMLVGGGFVAFMTGLFGHGSYADADAKSVFNVVIKKWWLPIVFGSVAVLSPSTTTIYMIAASEAGETVIQSPEAREVFNDLKTIIKSKLKEQLPKDVAP